MTAAASDRFDPRRERHTPGESERHLELAGGSPSDMDAYRRRALGTVGATTLAALAGCTTGDLFGSGESRRSYTLDVERISVSPVEHALYEPDDGALFGDPARTALAEILPEGRHTTYGYEPLPDDAYVERGGTYYRTVNVVTGRERMERALVRAESVPEEEVPDDALLVDELDRPVARVVKILHSYAVTDGETSTAELLRGDAYVLRRPAETESRLGTGELDGRVVTMTAGGSGAYRLSVTREPITETAHTALAVPVADSRERFREVVFGSRIDADLAPDDLAPDVRDLLETAVRRESYEATAPLPEAFETLLGALGLDTDESVNGRLLWYDGGFYRYALYVGDAS